MKKSVLILGLSVALLFGFNGCVDDAGDNCKYCKEVTRDESGNIIDRGLMEEFCGNDLDAIDGVTDTDPDGNKTEWVCN